ncbi:MAG: preprotein translocase subunit SecA [Phycisphaerales bacterium]
MAKQEIPVVGPILNFFLGSRNERFVKKYTARVNAINAQESKFRVLTDAQLRAKVDEFRSRVDRGEKPVDLMIEAFAAAREAMDRSVGLRNIFSPLHAEKFNPDALPADARQMYEAVKAEIATRQPAPPTGEFLGCSEPVGPYLQVDIPPALYEAVRALYPESRPPFRARPFDVQLIGARVLSEGRISEMKTGEGKTIVGPLATYLACIERLKVHVVTVNDYLVQRDRDWTFPFFHALGLTVGAIHPQHMQGEDVKRRMYQCDVVYGTTAEFGFDYLRDNMKRSVEQQVQRRREFAVVDEVDSILIDEARTPLIISGPAHEGVPRYAEADRLARHLVEKNRPWQEASDRADECERRIKGLEGDVRNARDRSKIPAMQQEIAALRAELPKLQAAKSRHVQYYETQLERKQCHLTHDGIAEAQRVAQVGSFYVGENMDMPHLLEQALRAHVVYERDKDYVVMPAENPQTGRVEPSVVIVDVNTGRPMVGRQWSDGLHQACECKEGVTIKQETQTVATITIQNFFKMYKRLSGMTGTADTEAQEFYDIYKLDVVSIPTNKQVRRRDYDDLVFLSMKDKWSFIVDEIRNFSDIGRPVLVGTTSVGRSEELSKLLTARYGIKHEVLNAKQHEREALIVENAGQLGAVMIATNMAGRGTDIKLGQISRQTLLDHWLRRNIAPREVTVDFSDEQLREACYRKIAPGIRDLGVSRADVEKMPFAELELMLLRYWVMMHTTTPPSEKEAARMDAETLRKELDRHGRFLLHRLRWFSDIEDLGGLHVIGTERHESRRIDNQLRGRSGRQGDRGSSRFFISLEDDLMKMFAGDKVNWLLGRLGMKEGDAIEHPILSKSVENAQRKVEEINFQRRKYILEYDEVMEHQRQRFYGLRQRALEGRDLKGLIFDYIRDATKDAVAELMNESYPARCLSDYAKRVADCTIPPARFKGAEINEAEEKIRIAMKEDARNLVNMTLGEYLPDELTPETASDVDAAGLIKWARDRFGIEISPSDLENFDESRRRELVDRLLDAAEARADAIELRDIPKYMDPAYGPEELARWAHTKFEITITVDQIRKAQTESLEAVEKLIIDEARKLYKVREIEHPVDFRLELTSNRVRMNPQLALSDFTQWANTRFGLSWTVDDVIARPPAQVREELIKASREFVESDRLEKAVQEAMACADDEARDKHFREKLRSSWPEHLRRLKGQELADAVRARVESVLREELVFFERTMLLEILDGIWKDHLYSMDQLKDGISLRAYSQQDPRIEFKREGSRMFNDMMQTVRERITDFVFKYRVPPQMLVSQAPAPAAPAPRPIGPGISIMTGGGSSSQLMPPPVSAQGAMPAPAAPRPVAAPIAGAAPVAPAPGRVISVPRTMLNPAIGSSADLYVPPSQRKAPPADPAANGGSAPAGTDQAGGPGSQPGSPADPASGDQPRA